MRYQYPESATHVLAEVLAERDRQQQKWGEQNHTPMHWLPILMEEVGEASKEALECHFNSSPGDRYTKLRKYRMEMIQVAAVAVAMVESLDRNGIPG